MIMKNFSLLIVLISITLSLSAQEITGTVSGKNEGPLPGATVKVNGGDYAVSTDENGEFSLKQLSAGKYVITVSYIGYESERKEVALKANETVTLNFELKASMFETDEITVLGTRAQRNSPVTYSTVSKEDIERNNSGKDIPYLLEMTPSLVSNSDAGAGIGYTSMRIRGSDVSRINVTLDGIPLNDSESQGVWWVDLPDYASSVENIQVQRGVGTSTNGAGAFGANINFKTERPGKKPSGEINTAYGSFNSIKSNVKAGTGLINNRFALDARVSKIKSDGYIDRAYTDMESVQLSGIYSDSKNLLRVNFMHGIEETYQAWGGVPKDSLESNRTFNPYTYENEIDHYIQTHTHLSYTRQISSNFYIKTALHYTKGKGYYEQYKDDEDFADYLMEPVTIGDTTIESSDLIRRKWLDNDFFGLVFSANYTQSNFNFTFGGAANEYIGGHFGRVIRSEYAGISRLPHKWYENTGDKADRNIYGKLNYKITNSLNAMLDLQYRNIVYEISGIDDDLRDISQKHIYHFFNPKAGINYTISDESRTFFSLATANREPTRTDLKDAISEKEPQPERLYDYELGYNYSTSALSLSANLYYMHYKNQLVLTGQINDVGNAISVNVPNSYRTGIELSTGTEFWNFLIWEANASFSRNKIKNYTAYVDDWDNWGEQKQEFYEETDISFSPSVVAKNRLTAEITENLSVSVNTQYVSRQYIDNTSNKERSINPYLVNDLKINYRLKFKKLERIDLFFNLNNFLNEAYETNAWVYRFISGNEKSAMYGYYPQAGIHFMSGINIKF
jgi:iron complex outermembrane recepter protein